MAGLIFGLYKQYRYQEVLNFATAAAFNKLFIESDATTATVEEVLRSIKSD